MPETLYTRWGRELESRAWAVLGTPSEKEFVPLPEYPRPGLVRESYLNLNGFWDYAFTESEDLPGEYEGKILVPFSPETVLSGVKRQLKPDEYLHYRRTFSLPAGTDTENGRYILHFGAVDQSCAVFVNGVKAGGHTGGYLPFSFDVTDLVREGENLLQVCVRDLSDTSYHARGKQKLEPGGMWYGATSGIWQTVWMEQVPGTYITGVKITPDPDRSRILVRVLCAEKSGIPVRAQITLRGKPVLQADLVSGKTCALRLEDFESWTPETPVLYDMTLTMGEDAVYTYFAMRKVCVSRDAKGILRFFLNGKPYFHNGLLDQGYYPDGAYTAPSDEALCFDILRMKQMGFTMLRKHIKIEPERWYYHCDRIGMLVWQDMVNGGETYHSWFVTYMPNILMWTGRVFSDRPGNLLARKNKEGREEFLSEVKETIRLLYNHPCIAAWVAFNEGWGQFDAARVTKLIRKLDPTRLIDEASGWFDRRSGDMYSLHNYFRPLKVRPKKDRVFALTEFGGYFLQIPGHTVFEKMYGYRKFTSKEDLTEGIAALWRKELIPGIRRGLGATVYTQVTDVEEELNGLLTYDREVVKVDEEKILEVNRELLETFEKNTAGL